MSHVVVQGGLTTTVTNWPWCDWLCIEGSALLPTKTHTSLDVTGTSLGTHRGTQHDDTTQGNYGIYKKLHSLGRVSFNFFLFFSLLSAAYRKQTHPEGLWRVRIRGSITQNLRVLPVCAKPNKSLECLPKTNNWNKDKKKEKKRVMSVYGRRTSKCVWPIWHVWSKDT